MNEVDYRIHYNNKDLEESERIRLERKLLSEIPLEVGKKM